MDYPSQDPVLTFLGREFGESCRRIDTHAASIFLAGDRAWKLKRAVCLPYLDFSTADARRAALEAELRLNRRTAPDLYIAVHPIARTAAGFRIGGDGEPVDWLLEMKRFPDGARLDELAERKGLDGDLMLRLADRIHAFHEQASPAPHPHASRDLHRVIEGNRESFRGHEHVFGGDRIERLIGAHRLACDHHAALLDARGRTGKVRHVHGDLHLANIAVIDGQPIPFDCLEFSEDLATSDVLYDLAFLLMDLWHRDQRHAANLVFNRYIDLSADEEGVRLLPLLQSLRATVRAHVLATTAARSGKATDTAEAERFFALAERLAGTGPAAAVAIGGLSGTGKSVVARAIGGDFGSAPGARILRSDVLRKRLAGVPPEQHLSEAFYTPLASRTVYVLLAQWAGHHVRCHRFVIVDAVLAGDEERALLVRAATHAHAAFVGCWLETPVEQRLARVRLRRGDASDADEEVIQRQASRNIGIPDGWIRISAGENLIKTIADVQAEIRNHLEDFRQGRIANNFGNRATN